MLKLAVAGFGAIGQELVRLLQADPLIQVSQIIVPHEALEKTALVARQLAPQAAVVTALERDADGPDLLVECAGHAAIIEHIVPALRGGLRCVVTSVGALHQADVLLQLEAAARQGDTRVQLIAGAIGAIDALSAAELGGLEEVTYIGRKPPRSWLGTPADKLFQLELLAAPLVIFQGTAREAASLYPQNANVAATVALAGLGLDRTVVRLIADPGVERNVHKIEATGAFGRLELVLENRSLPTNPKTSSLAAYSLARAVRNAASPLFF
jgi:aspartate dehydrogenase